MISSAGRCNSGGGSRVSAMSKEIRFVNVGNGGAVVVGGFVNHCEQGLDNQNTLVLVERPAVVPVSDQTVATINHRVYPPSSNEMGKLKDLTINNVMLLEEYSKSVALQNEKIIQLTNEVKFVSWQFDITLVKVYSLHVIF